VGEEGNASILDAKAGVVAGGNQPCALTALSKHTQQAQPMQVHHSISKEETRSIYIYIVHSISRVRVLYIDSIQNTS
jgi:hypothetical protein